MVSASEVTSRTSRLLALINHLVNGIESLIMDCQCREGYLDIDLNDVEGLLGGEVPVYLNGCIYKPDKLFELRRLIDYGLVNNVLIRLGSVGIRYGVLYNIAFNIIDRDLITYIRDISLRASLTGIEYMYVVLDDGKAVLIEGDVDKVVIPKVNSVLSIHTHRYGCLPSPNDLKSLTELLFDGGLGAGIVSPECYLLIYRVGPFTEDDYIAIKNLRGSLEEIKAIPNNIRLGRSLILRMHHL